MLFLIKNDIDLLNECGFLKNDNNCFYLELKNTLMEEIDEYLHGIKNRDESLIERAPKNKWNNTLL